MVLAWLSVMLMVKRAYVPLQPEFRVITMVSEQTLRRGLRS